MTATLREFLDGLTATNVATTVVDVALVYYLIYRLLLTIRGTRAAQMVVGIVLVGAAFYAAQLLPAARGLLPAVTAGSGQLFTIPEDRL